MYAQSGVQLRHHISFRCFQLVTCNIILYALCNAIMDGCIQFQSLQHIFQCIAQHCNCELMNTEISDNASFFRQFFSVFGLSYTNVSFFKLSDIGLVFRYTDP